jgi:hypothetical protein
MFMNLLHVSVVAAATLVILIVFFTSVTVSFTSLVLRLCVKPFASLWVRHDQVVHVVVIPVEATFSDLTVLSYAEVPSRVDIQSAGTLASPEPMAMAA